MDRTFCLGENFVSRTCINTYHSNRNSLPHPQKRSTEAPFGQIFSETAGKLRTLHLKRQNTTLLAALIRHNPRMIIIDEYPIPKP